MPETQKGFRYPAGSDSPNIAQYFQNLATDVENAFVVPLWVTLPISGFTAVAGSPPQYCKTTDGTVHLRGEMLNTNSYASPSGVIATLPIGYRPGRLLWIPAFYDVPAGHFSAHLEVAASGTIRFLKFSVSPAAGVSHRLDGVSFLAEG